MLKEFKEFALRGNMLDLAVGVIIGGAFGKIVSSLVDDVLMPPIGMLTGGTNFNNLYLVLGPGQTPGPYASLEAARSAGAATLAYGAFVNNIITFLFVAIALFFFIKGVNRMRRAIEGAPAPAAPAGPPPQEVLLTEIRDILKTK